MDKQTLIDVIQAILDRENANGCISCEYEEKEEWEMPCAKCKRNCKDYWRYKTHD